MLFKLNYESLLEMLEHRLIDVVAVMLDSLRLDAVAAGGDEVSIGLRLRNVDILLAYIKHVYPAVWRSEKHGDTLKTWERQLAVMMRKQRAARERKLEGGSVPGKKSVGDIIDETFGDEEVDRKKSDTDDDEDDIGAANVFTDDILDLSVAKKQRVCERFWAFVKQQRKTAAPNSKNSSGMPIALRNAKVLSGCEGVTFPLAFSSEGASTSGQQQQAGLFNVDFYLPHRNNTVIDLVIGSRLNWAWDLDSTGSGGTAVTHSLATESRWRHTLLAAAGYNVVAIDVAGCSEDEMVERMRGLVVDGHQH